jgi:hypothetical protein
MSVQLAYAGEGEYNNTKALFFTATFKGNYGVNGTGDLINLEPSQNNGADGGVTDPSLAYNLILTQPPKIMGVINEAIGGSYVAVNIPAKPTLTNIGLIMYEPGGTEKATNAAYTAAELAGNVTLVAYVRSEQ